MKDDRAMSGSAFSSPVTAEVGGKNQLLIQAREELAGLDLESGKVIWRYKVKAFRGMNILTPTVIGDTIFTSSVGFAFNTLLALFTHVLYAVVGAPYITATLLFCFILALMFIKVRYPVGVTEQSKLLAAEFHELLQNPEEEAQKEKERDAGKEKDKEKEEKEKEEHGQEVEIEWNPEL